MVDPKVMEGLSKVPVTNMFPFASMARQFAWSARLPTALFAQVAIPEGEYLTINTSMLPELVSVFVPNASDGLLNEPVTMILEFESIATQLPFSKLLPPACLAQSTFPVGEYLTMKMSLPPEFVNVVVPKAMDGLSNEPVT